MFLPLLSILISSLSLSSANTFPLQNRAPSYGGVALQAEPCPEGTNQCGSDHCCPSQFPFCDHLPSSGYACCPDSSGCKHSVQAGPACADDSWSLWQGVYNGFFCCLSNQIGMLNEVDGVCVASNVPVSATLLATRLAAASTTLTGSSNSATGTASSKPTTASGNTSSSATTIPSSTSSKSSANSPTTGSGTAASSTGNSGSAKVIQVEGMFSGIVGIFSSLFLFIF